MAIFHHCHLNKKFLIHDDRNIRAIAIEVILNVSANIIRSSTFVSLEILHMRTAFCAAKTINSTQLK